MTISCTCPKCEQVCGFKDEYAGRRARCLACGTRFTIPLRSSEPADAVPEPPTEPLPGFYGAIVRDTAAALVRPESLPGLILCVTLTTFHFFLGDKDYSLALPGFRLPLVIGWIVTGIAGGYLLWYFIETISETADGYESLPEIGIDGGFAFVGHTAKSIYFFVVTFAVPLLPAWLLINIMADLGIEIPVLNAVIVGLCLLAAPLVLAVLACGAPPWMVFRFDRLAVIIAKTAGPYLLTAAITLASLLLMGLTVGRFAATAASALTAAAVLAARIAAVLAALVAMRTLGLYARHHFDMFPELNPPEY